MTKIKRTLCSLSACDLYCVGRAALQRSTALHYAAASIMTLMMRHHGDDVYMTSQLCCGLRGVAAKC